MADEGIPPDRLSDYFARMGRKGGHARSKKLTPEQRKAQRYEGIEGRGEGAKQKAPPYKSAATNNPTWRYGRLSHCVVAVVTIEIGCEPAGTVATAAS